MRVVAEAADGEQAVQSARMLGASGLDLVLIDAELPRLDGLAATERLAAELPAVAVVILTSTTELDRLVAALRAGAVGFLDKRLAPEVLVRSIRAFQNGESL